MTDTLEKVKIELRSILLSSKHGVALADIQSDYEQLMCQRLLYEELGFVDVKSLMKAMPDVAREVRSPNGQITYHAVCDESTAHIQKLVSNQTTKKKKPKYSKVRGRGHRGSSRGSVSLGREDHITRGHLGGRGRSKPRFLPTSNRGQPIRSFSTGSQVADGSGDYRNDSFSSDLIDYFTKGCNFIDEGKKSFKTSRAIVGRGVFTTEQIKSSDTDPEHISSRVCNLRIGINQTGKRFISGLDSAKFGKNCDSGELSSDDGSASSTPFDLRDIINKRRAHSVAAAAENHDEDDGAIGEKDFNLDTRRNKRVVNENIHHFKKNLPPRLQRMHDHHGSSYTQEMQVLLPTPVPDESQSHFSKENTFYSMEKNNWIPPENGRQYLETYNNYFAKRGEMAPEIEINSVKVKNEKGYHGLLIHNRKHYYPLEIMQNAEYARQNVARSFCLQNNIPLLTTEHGDKPTQSQLSSTFNTTSQMVMLDQNGAESNRTKSHLEVKPSSQVSHQPESGSSEMTYAHKRQSLPEILEKIYKMLKPNGIWAKKIADLYQETYGETITIDFLSQASQWPDYFTLENVGSRCLVYPVSDALTKAAEVNIINEEKVKEVNKTCMPVPPSLLPAVGSNVQVMVSFTYSAADLYVQKADTENLVYDINTILDNSCPEYSAPEVDALTVNSLIAANYEEGWYRAEIVTKEIPMVTVYFIDYGNREEINISDLRPIPQEHLTLNTPPLAIKCAVRKSKTGEWCKDVTTVLTELSENNPVLSARILEHEGDRCIIDLHTPEGRLVNDMLIQPSSVLTPQQNQTNPQRIASIEQEKRQSVRSSGHKLFADDPEPLVIPESASFAVYVCRVMSENAVLLRIVDDDYSDKLDQLEQQIADNFYAWPVPKELRSSNIYAGMVLAGVDDAEDVEYDEEKCSDQNKYYRVRMLRENKDGICDCYLPDHGHDEVLNASQLREIDPNVNLSLSYQAVMAKLYGLDKVPDIIKPMAVQILIKLLTNGSTFHAIKKSKTENQLTGMDATIVTRVRKIISCMKELQPAVVAKIYLDVYKEPLDNVEEVIKNIPGYGCWRESLMVDLVDTSQEDGDININEFVLAKIEEMTKVQSQGGSIENVWRALFSSNTCQTDTDSESFQDGSYSSTGKDSLDVLNKISSDHNGIDNEAKLNRVLKYVQDLKPETQDDNIKPATSKALYTWNTKPEIQATAVSSSHTPTTSPPSSLLPSICDNSSLPKFWTYPLLQFVSLQIVRVESPSYFVVIPVEQRGALGKLEMAIAQYFSSNSVEPVTSFSNDVLYAVKFKDGYCRSLYVNMIGDMVKVFFPDHHSYDTVQPSELFILPQQFYSLPFLAHRSCLGGVVPNGHEWPEHVIEWFKDAINNKCLYAVITEVTHSSNDPRLPECLVMRLIDTSGSEDLVLDEYMESQRMAVRSPNSD